MTGVDSAHAGNSSGLESSAAERWELEAAVSTTAQRLCALNVSSILPESPRMKPDEGKSALSFSSMAKSRLDVSSTWAVPACVSKLDVDKGTVQDLSGNSMEQLMGCGRVAGEIGASPLPLFMRRPAHHLSESTPLLPPLPEDRTVEMPKLDKKKTPNTWLDRTGDGSLRLEGEGLEQGSGSSVEFVEKAERYVSRFPYAAAKKGSYLDSELPYARKQGLSTGCVESSGKVWTASDRGWHCPEEDAELMHSLSTVHKARKRQLALFATMAVELFVAFVISRFTHTVQRYPLLVAFMPVISAVSGNVGLQSSSITTRAIAFGYVTRENWLQACWREFKVSVVLAVSCATALACVSFLWERNWAFAMVIALSLFLAICTAAVTGSLAPVVGKSLGFDPAAFAGPLETALQDIIGNSCFLLLASLLMDLLMEGQSRRYEEG